nr:heme uptake protein IsdC [Paenibacillus hamazuiensis]
MIPALSLLLSSSLFAATGVFAADKLSDGTYTVGYLVKQAENDSVSMANDYFEKPAELFVFDGRMELQVQMNHSKWITVFKAPDRGGFKDAQIVRSDDAADTRVVRFPVDDLSKPLPLKIHVTVEKIDYDHDYTIRFVFDEKSIKAAEAAKPGGGNAADKTAPAMDGMPAATAGGGGVPGAGAAMSPASEQAANAQPARESEPPAVQGGDATASAPAGGSAPSATAGGGGVPGAGAATSPAPEQSANAQPAKASEPPAMQGGDATASAPAGGSVPAAQGVRVPVETGNLSPDDAGNGKPVSDKSGYMWPIVLSAVVAAALVAYAGYRVKMRKKGLT